MIDENDVDAILIDSVERLHLGDDRQFSIEVKLPDMPQPVYLFLSQDQASRLTDMLLQATTSSPEGAPEFEFPQNVAGEVDVHDVEVDLEPGSTDNPFVISFDLGSHAPFRMRLSHSAVARWYSRLGQQIKEHMRKTAN